MKRETAIIHLLKLAYSFQNFVHWQVTCRIALGSLYLDARISDITRNQISDMIANRDILGYATIAKVDTSTWS
jgi:hypothetical protein